MAHDHDPASSHDLGQGAGGGRQRAGTDGAHGGARDDDEPRGGAHDHAHGRHKGAPSPWGRRST
jgi:hypothetical protein